jgi:hypothetical protein
MVNPQSVTITNIVTTWYKQSYKQDLFPQYLKTKSIPHFKKNERNYRIS